MNNVELGKLVKQKYPEYTKYSDEEIGSKMMSKYPQYSSNTTKTKTVNPLTSEKTTFEKVAPTAGSMLGGFLGPVGTGAGYSIGSSLAKIKEQMRTGGEDVLANMFGQAKGLKMTPYGEQRTQELGMTGTQGATPDLLKSLMQSGQKLTNQPEFSYGQEAKKNILTPESTGKVKKFENQNLGGAAVAGLSDYGMRAVTNVITSKLLPKINPKLGVDGIKPNVVSQNAKEAADEVWKPIQKTLESANKSGKVVDVTEAVTKLEKRINKIKSVFGEGGLNSDATDEIAGIQKVIDNIKSSSKMQGGSYLLNPEATQKVAGYFGKESFSPTTKLGKLSSDIENSAEITAKQEAAPLLKKKLFEVLDSSGLTNSAELYKDYGTLVNLASSMRKPIQGMFEAGVTGTMVGGLGTMMGLPQVGVPAGMVAFLNMTPIGQQIFRELVKSPIKAVPTVARTVAPSLIESKLNQFMGVK